MELADLGKPEEENKEGECEDKSNNINIDISLIMGKMGGRPGHGMGKPFGEEEDDDDDDDKGKPCIKDMLEKDDEDTDWKSIAKQLLQAVSMMDTHTDGVDSGTEDPEGAIKAIDNETSRILWGKQEDDNPRSSYQNANYGKTTANGLVMTNPAEVYNDEAYGKEEEKPSNPPTAPMIPEHKEVLSDDDDSPEEKAEDLREGKETGDDREDMKGKGFRPQRFKKPGKFKQAAEGIIKRGKDNRPADKFDDHDDDDDMMKDEVD